MSIKCVLDGKEYTRVRDTTITLVIYSKMDEKVRDYGILELDE
jgi:hypothetical protein